MCGVVGILSQRNLADEARIHSALKAISHRGPDGAKVWSENGSIALGHARLSIIDIDGGTQPLSNEDNSIYGVVNGEFYEFEKIRATLIQQGHTFKTGSDSEILIHLYEEYGTNCLEHLRGEFAFILWDSNKKVLFAARDRFGIKPLCYAEVDGELLIASEAKALFATGVRKEWDHASVFHAMSMQYVPSGRTLFKGVNQVKPGHFILATSNSVSERDYWDLNYPTIDSPTTKSSRTELIQGFEAALREAIAIRTRADVPVACYLSGGLDSSSVLGFASAVISAPLHCFSVSFPGTPYDESALAQEMASKAGATFHSLPLSSADLINALPDACYYSEGLAINGHLPAKFLLSKHTQQAGYKVVLTGEGSDELLCGYPHLQEDLFLDTDSNPEHVKDAVAKIHGAHFASRGIMLPSGPALSTEAVTKRLGFVPSFIKAKACYGNRMHQILKESFLSHFKEADCFKSFATSLPFTQQLLNRSNMHRAMYLWNKSALANYILRTLGDGTEMAHSIEGRVPFLDHKLFEFTKQLPADLLVNEGVEKYALREVARGKITESIYKRTKHPFMAPPLTIEGDGSITETVKERVLGIKTPFFDLAKLEQVIEGLPALNESERKLVDPLLLTALSVGAIKERFELAEE